MDTAYLTSKGRVVVPARLGRRYGIKPGTKFCFIEMDGDILFRPVTLGYIRSVCGMLKSKTSATRALLKERAREKKLEEARIKRFRVR